MHNNHHLLIAEDSTTQAAALAALLEDNHYQVTVARDGEEALALLPLHSFSLVLTDIMMPRMGGYELCRRIKQELRLEVPVVLLTSLNDPHDIIRGLECGADNYITKPYEPRHLLARIRNVLDTRTLRRVTRATMGVEITFMGTRFNVNSEKEQILDLFLSSVEDVVNANQALESNQRELSAAHAELARAHEQLANYARELERRERVSAEKYRSLMQTAFDGVFVLDIDGSILEANRRATELTRLTQDQLTGRKLETVVAPADADRFHDRFARLREVGHVQMKDVRLKSLDAGEVYCDVHASCARHNDEYLVLVILEDVTERRRAEIAIRESNEMLQTLIEASPLCIIALDPQGRVTLWNQAAQRVLGWSREKAVGKLLPGVRPERRSIFKALQARIVEGERISGMEIIMHTQRGEARELNMWAAPLLDSRSANRGWVALLADMSEQKTLEQQLRHAQKMEAVGTLAGGVAHDFNNVLTAITGYADVLLEEIQQKDLVADINEIKKAANRATALTRQLLAFSRKQVMQPQVVDLNAVIADMQSMLRRLVREDISFSLDLDENLGMVYVDPVQVEQVLLNLVVNARDAAGSSGDITVKTRNVELDGDGADLGAGSYVMLAVSDTGIGMDRETQKHVFEPFFTTKPKDRGTGLGLSTVYGIVKQSNGHIEIDSEVGKGTTFSVYLPRVQGSPQPQTERADSRSHAAPATILLVEDEDAVRELIARVLSRKGYEVLQASNGAEALDIASRREGTISLLLTDIVMPNIGGPELRQKLAETRADLPVLFMSGYAEETLLTDRTIESGAFLIQKPFSPAGLLEKVADVLNNVKR